MENTSDKIISSVSDHTTGNDCKVSVSQSSNHNNGELEEISSSSILHTPDGNAATNILEGQLNGNLQEQLTDNVNSNETNRKLTPQISTSPLTVEVSSKKDHYAHIKRSSKQSRTKKTPQKDMITLDLNTTSRIESFKLQRKSAEPKPDAKIPKTKDEIVDTDAPNDNILKESETQEPIDKSQKISEFKNSKHHFQKNGKQNIAAGITSKGRNKITEHGIKKRNQDKSLQPDNSKSSVALTINEKSMDSDHNAKAVSSETNLAKSVKSSKPVRCKSTISRQAQSHVGQNISKDFTYKFAPKVSQKARVGKIPLDKYGKGCRFYAEMPAKYENKGKKGNCKKHQHAKHDENNNAKLEDKDKMNRNEYGVCGQKLSAGRSNLKEKRSSESNNTVNSFLNILVKDQKRKSQAESEVDQHKISKHEKHSLTTEENAGRKLQEDETDQASIVSPVKRTSLNIFLPTDEMPEATYKLMEETNLNSTEQNDTPPVAGTISKRPNTADAYRSVSDKYSNRYSCKSAVTRASHNGIVPAAYYSVPRPNLLLKTSCANTVSIPSAASESQLSSLSKGHQSGFASRPLSSRVGGKLESKTKWQQNVYPSVEESRDSNCLQEWNVSKADMDKVGTGQIPTEGSEYANNIKGDKSAQVSECHECGPVTAGTLKRVKMLQQIYGEMCKQKRDNSNAEQIEEKTDKHVLKYQHGVNVKTSKSKYADSESDLSETSKRNQIVNDKVIPKHKFQATIKRTEPKQCKKDLIQNDKSVNGLASSNYGSSTSCSDDIYDAYARKKKPKPSKLAHSPAKKSQIDYLSQNVTGDRVVNVNVGTSNEKDKVETSENFKKGSGEITLFEDKKVKSTLSEDNKVEATLCEDNQVKSDSDESKEPNKMKSTCDKLFDHFVALCETMKVSQEKRKENSKLRPPINCKNCFLCQIESSSPLELEGSILDRLAICMIERMKYLTITGEEGLPVSDSSSSEIQQTISEMSQESEEAEQSDVTSGKVSLLDKISTFAGNSIENELSCRKVERSSAQESIIDGDIENTADNNQISDVQLKGKDFFIPIVKPVYYRVSKNGPFISLIGNPSIPPDAELFYSSNRKCMQEHESNIKTHGDERLCSGGSTATKLATKKQSYKSPEVSVPAESNKCVLEQQNTSTRKSDKVKDFQYNPMLSKACVSSTESECSEKSDKNKQIDGNAQPILLFATESGKNTNSREFEATHIESIANKQNKQHQGRNSPLRILTVSETKETKSSDSHCYTNKRQESKYKTSKQTFCDAFSSGSKPLHPVYENKVLLSESLETDKTVSKAAAHKNIEDKSTQAMSSRKTRTRSAISAKSLEASAENQIKERNKRYAARQGRHENSNDISSDKDCAGIVPEVGKMSAKAKRRQQKLRDHVASNVINSRKKFWRRQIKSAPISRDRKSSCTSNIASEYVDFVQRNKFFSSNQCCDDRNSTIGNGKESAACETKMCSSLNNNNIKDVNNSRSLMQDEKEAYCTETNVNNNVSVLPCLETYNPNTGNIVKQFKCRTETDFQSFDEKSCAQNFPEPGSSDFSAVSTLDLNGENAEIEIDTDEVVDWQLPNEYDTEEVTFTITSSDGTQLIVSNKHPDFEKILMFIEEHKKQCGEDSITIDAELSLNSDMERNQGNNVEYPKDDLECIEYESQGICKKMPSDKERRSAADFTSIPDNRNQIHTNDEFSSKQTYKLKSIRNDSSLCRVFRNMISEEFLNHCFTSDNSVLSDQCGCLPELCEMNYKYHDNIFDALTADKVDHFEMPSKGSLQAEMDTHKSAEKVKTQSYKSKVDEQGDDSEDIVYNEDNSGIKSEIVECGVDNRDTVAAVQTNSDEVLQEMPYLQPEQYVLESESFRSLDNNDEVQYMQLDQTDSIKPFTENNNSKDGITNNDKNYKSELLGLEDAIKMEDIIEIQNPGMLTDGKNSLDVRNSEDSFEMKTKIIHEDVQSKESEVCEVVPNLATFNCRTETLDEPPELINEKDNDVLATDMHKLPPSISEDDLSDPDYTLYDDYYSHESGKESSDDEKETLKKIGEKLKRKKRTKTFRETSKSKDAADNIKEEAVDPNSDKVTNRSKNADDADLHVNKHKLKCRKRASALMNEEDFEEEEAKRREKEEQIAAEGFIKTQQKYMEIILNQSVEVTKSTDGNMDTNCTDQRYFIVKNLSFCFVLSFGFTQPQFQLIDGKWNFQSNKIKKSFFCNISNSF